jgi:uncharacterized protein YgbK (DUF1537 family)
MPATPDYVFIGDDFTGASDTLATLARNNVRVRLFLDVPTSGELTDGEFDAIGIATDLRALSVPASRDRLAPILELLGGLSPRIVHFKICSTFDSAPEVGNVSVVAQLLEICLEPKLVAILGGQPSLRRYCLFGTLFAAAPDGAIHRIDRHPVMSRHPVTPMTESDIARHLAVQGLTGLVTVDWRDIAAGPDHLSALVAASIEEDRRRMLFDVATDSDIRTIGAAITEFAEHGQPLLAIGASGVAEALAAHVPQRRPDSEPATVRKPAGPCFILAGSRSELTAAQVSNALKFRKVSVGALDLGSDEAADDLARQCADHLANGDNVLAHLDPAADYGMGGETLAASQGDFAAKVLARQSIGGLGIAGGDTSSLVVRRLGFRSLDYDRPFDAGVAICTGSSPDPSRDGMTMILKGGQMGAPDIFDRFAGFVENGAFPA